MLIQITAGVFFVTIIGCSAMSVYGAVQWQWCSLLCSSPTHWCRALQLQLVAIWLQILPCLPHHHSYHRPFHNRFASVQPLNFNVSKHGLFWFVLLQKFDNEKGWRSLILSCPTLLWINWTNCATITCYTGKRLVLDPSVLCRLQFPIGKPERGGFCSTPWMATRWNRPTTSTATRWHPTHLIFRAFGSF